MSISIARSVISALTMVVIASYSYSVCAVDDGGRCPTCGKLTLKGASHVCKKLKMSSSHGGGSYMKNVEKKINIDGFCGHAFRESNTNSTCELSCKANKKYFGNYENLVLKYSPSAGLYSIAAINNDSFAIGDVEKEILRMVGIFERKFRVTFSHDISTTSNAKYENVVEERPVIDSVTKGISEYRKQSLPVMTSLATEKYHCLREEFKNAVVEFYGVDELTTGKKTVRCTVSIKNQ